ncbi:MAG: undecaprenyl-diphosphatase, partial [Bacteroidetes bacterium]|nr:undecaprenyl-diphosphatase [Bacteroidota bacterium]
KLKVFVHGIPGNEIGPLVWGTLFSGIFGFLAIKYFMRYLQRHTLKAFVWYRLLFALVIILFVYII